VAPMHGKIYLHGCRRRARIVLSVIAGEMSIAEATRREKISEQSIGRWKADFLEAGKTALVAGKSGLSTREEQGPEDLEVIRVQAGMSTTRFCRLIDMPERDLAPLAGQDLRRRPSEGSVAAAGSPGRGGVGAQARVGASGVGTPQDLGDGPPRRPRGL
jgi:hypothetical protein